MIQHEASAKFLESPIKTKNHEERSNKIHLLNQQIDNLTLYYSGINSGGTNSTNQIEKKKVRFTNIYDA